MAELQGFGHTTSGANLADVIERILDKGVVIVGDVVIKIADMELLSIKIKLLVCSVDKARELGVVWWENHPDIMAPEEEESELDDQRDETIQELTEFNRELLNKLENLKREVNQLSQKVDS